MAQFNGSADNIENNKNKVISISKDSSHEQYPSAKATFEAVKNETAKFISLEDNTEWVFNGGDASGSVGVELVIDNEMSDKSDNLVSNKIIKRYVDEKFLSCYPVGSIYMSMNDIDPAFLFGGEWERIENTFLLACGDTYAAGSTGGEAEHKLKENELPKITGKAGFRDTYTDDHDTILSFSGALSVEKTTWEGAHSALQVVEQSNYEVNNLKLNFGGGLAHNNMPPYLAVHMWQRIA